MNPETKLKIKVLKYLRSINGLWVCKVNDQFTSGIPDILICYHGHFAAIELKCGKNKTTPLQDYVLEKIYDAGGSTCVAYSLDEVKNFINLFKRG